MNNSDVLLRHLTDLCDRSRINYNYEYSNFLTLAEQEDFLKLPGRPGDREFRFMSLNPAPERKIAVFGDPKELGYAPEPPLSVIGIYPESEKYAEELTHRDYLGALLNLGTTREVIGDIIIKERHAYIICLSPMVPFLCENLTKIKHTGVKCHIETGELPELAPKFNVLNINVASERIDSIVAGFTGLSRSHAVNLFPAEKVAVNGHTVTDRSMNLKEGDILSVRGFGKAVYDGISYETKKGRYYVRLRKYG